MIDLFVLLHVIHDPPDVVVVKLWTAVLPAEFNHIFAIVFAFDFEDLGGDLSRDGALLGRLLLEQLAQLFVHLGRLNVASDGVGDLPDVLVHRQLVDDFAPLDHALQPVEQVRCGDLRLDQLRAGDVLPADVRVEAEGYHVASRDLILSQRSDAVRLLALGGSATDRSSSALPVDQAGNGQRFVILGRLAVHEVLSCLFRRQGLVSDPGVHEKVGGARPQEGVGVEHRVDQALEIVGKGRLGAVIVPRVVALLVDAERLVQLIHGHEVASAAQPSHRLEWRALGDHGEEDDAQREHVDSDAAVAAILQNLRRHVARRAQKGRDLPVLVATLHFLRKAKIRHPDVEVLTHQHILQLDVTVHQPRLVKEGQPSQHLEEELLGDVLRDRAHRIVDVIEELAVWHDLCHDVVTLLLSAIIVPPGDIVATANNF